MKSLINQLKALVVLMNVTAMSVANTLTNPLGSDGSNVEQAVESLATTIAGWISTIAGLLGLIMFMMIGITWMSGKKDEAKDQLMSWVGGVGAISLAGSVVSGIYAAFA